MYGKSLARVIVGALLSFITIFSIAADNASVTAPAATPLEVYGSLPTLEDVALSPDGTRIAFVRNKGDDRITYIASLTEHKTLYALSLGTTKLRELIWGDNDHLLMVTSTTEIPLELSGLQSEFYILKVFDVVSGKSMDALRNDSNKITLNAIRGVPVLRRVKGNPTVFVVGYAAQNNQFLPALFRFSLTNGHDTIIAHGAFRSTHWFVDRDGDILATETYVEREKKWKLNVRIDDHMTLIASGGVETEYPTLAGLAPDGSALWFSTLENNNFVWKSVALKDGALSGPLAETENFESLITELYTDRVIGGRLSNADRDPEFFDSHLRAAWNAIKHLFPDERVDLVSASESFKKMVLLIDGPRHGLDYVLFDADTSEVTRLGPAYDGLNQYLKVRTLHYQAGDGLEIPAFVTLPPNRAAKNLPLVVLPHGGPTSKDTDAFDWLAQTLASRGYAVLQANYRGSDLGWKFISAGFGEWGRKMQTDLSDGVRALAKQGLVNPKRVCIVGADYGGYAALAGASLDVGVYRCAVSIAGISDLSAFQTWLAPQYQIDSNTSIRYFNRYLGAEKPNDPVITARSPLQQAANITIPILLIHGRDDSVVPYEQSESMARVLQQLNKPVELITLDKEDHWLSHSNTRLQMLQATVKFLLDNNPPD